MLIDSSNMQPSVNVYPNGGFMGGNGGFGDAWGGNGFFWILILFFFAMFGGWGGYGANAGGNAIFGKSYLPFGVTSKGNNRQLFRWNDSKKIKDAIDDAVKEGKNVRVLGHSWGGSTVANLAKDYPKIPFYALDPVSWTNHLKSIPDNLTILRPKDGAKADESWTTKLAPFLGGRWPKIESQPDRYIEYDGGHVVGLDKAVNKIVEDEWAKRESPHLWQYFASRGWAR